MSKIKIKITHHGKIITFFTAFKVKKKIKIKCLQIKAKQLKKL